MPGLDAIGAGAQGLSALINGVTGIFQRAKGRRLLKQAGESPTQYIPPEIIRNQEMATINANNGLPQEQYNQAMKNLQRQQLMMLKGSSDRRGGLLTLAGNQQAFNDSLTNLDVQNAKARIQNQNTLYGINNNVAGWKDKIWQNNVKAPWERKYQYAQSLIGSGNQNATTGLDQLGAAGLQYAAGGGFGRRGRSGSNYTGGYGSEGIASGQG